ncbi:MAG: hypothetical protein LBN92_02640 [Treponema sp.]|nr:hypothetical protein [Treponema sp.]
MKSIFRPAAFWESALMTLPDNAFFVLMRSVLGAIKTPFNKQNLLEDLSAFLSRPDIQKTMAAYIDDDDRRIIAAAALLGEPCEDELERFFSGEYSYVQLHALLLNLEERHVIYRFWDEKKSRLALNPRLENILAPIAENRSLLFHSFPAGGEKPAPAMTGSLFAALFAFFLRGGLSYRGNSLRKKVVDEGKRILGGIDLEAASGALLALGLFRKEGESLYPLVSRLQSFGRLPERNCFEYFASALACARPGDNYLSRGTVRLAARIFHRFTGMLEADTLYPGATLIKLLELTRREELSSDLGGYSSVLPPPRALLDAACASGLLAGKDPYCFSLPAGRATAQVIAVDSGFSCILYPEIAFKDALDLALFCEPAETGAALHGAGDSPQPVVRFTMTRDSVVRGMDRGCTARGIFDLVDRLSGGKAGEALKWNLDDWEKRYREISLCEGVVLTLSGDRAYLAESALAGMIARRLGEGVYLLKVDLEKAASALAGAGVDVISRPRAREHDGEYAFVPLESSLPVYAAAGASPVEETAGEKNGGEAEEALRKFRAVLAGMKLGRQEREELEARIDRRIVVSESQLHDTNIRYEKLEARSLDYVGKSSIARQALAAGSLIEATWNVSGREQKCLGVPESLDKKGGELILVLKPREGGDAVSIPLGKIGLLRRIKQSIFGE